MKIRVGFANYNPAGCDISDEVLLKVSFAGRVLTSHPRPSTFPELPSLRNSSLFLDCASFLLHLIFDLHSLHQHPLSPDLTSCPHSKQLRLLSSVSSALLSLPHLLIHCFFAIHSAQSTLDALLGFNYSPLLPSTRSPSCQPLLAHSFTCCCRQRYRLLPLLLRISPPLSAAIFT